MVFVASIWPSAMVPLTPLSANLHTTQDYTSGKLNQTEDSLLEIKPPLRHYENQKEALINLLAAEIIGIIMTCCSRNGPAGVLKGITIFFQDT